MPLTPPQREPAATATQPLDEDSNASPAKAKGAPEPPRPAPSSASTARRQPVFDNEEAPAPSENDPPASEAARLPGRDLYARDEDVEAAMALLAAHRRPARAPGECRKCGAPGAAHAVPHTTCTHHALCSSCLAQLEPLCQEDEEYAEEMRTWLCAACSGA